MDFARYKATGATIIVDAGGEILPDDGWDWPSRDVLNPQPQFEADGITPAINPNTGNNLSRTETGEVLGVSRSTSNRAWLFARKWLAENL